MSINLSHLYPRVTYRMFTAGFISYSLPDPKYVVDIHLSAYSVHCYIREDVSNREILHFPINKSKAPQWEELVHQFCELAHKRFPKPVRHNSVSMERHRRGW